MRLRELLLQQTAARIRCGKLTARADNRGADAHVTVIAVHHQGHFVAQVGAVHLQRDARLHILHTGQIPQLQDVVLAKRRSFHPEIRQIALRNRRFGG